MNTISIGRDNVGEAAASRSLAAFYYLREKSCRPSWPSNLRPGLTEPMAILSARYVLSGRSHVTLLNSFCFILFGEFSLAKSQRQDVFYRTDNFGEIYLHDVVSPFLCGF